MNLHFLVALAALALSAPQPDPSDSAVAAFRKAVAAAEADSGGVVGVAAMHIESGRRLSVRGGESFQMASVFKVPVAITALGAVEKGALRLDGVAGIRISLDEKGMGAAMKKDLAAFESGAENGASPDAIAALLARLFRGELLSRASTDRILDSMRRPETRRSQGSRARRGRRSCPDSALGAEPPPR